MTQHMPAKIWATYDWDEWSTARLSNDRLFIRADIAERMAVALEKTALVCSGDTVTKRGLIDALESARSALSAFRSATQDTEARHD